jgi:hypothetical protein
MRQLKRNGAQKESGTQGIEEGKTTDMLEIYGHLCCFLKLFHGVLSTIAVGQMVIEILVIIRCCIMQLQPVQQCRGGANAPEKLL